MKRMSGGLRSAVVVLVVALAACASPRSNVRFGSLVASRRSLDYDPGIAWWKLANQLTVAVMPRMVVMLGGRPPDTAAAFAAAGVTRFQTVTEEPAAAGPR